MSSSLSAGFIIGVGVELFGTRCTTANPAVSIPVNTVVTGVSVALLVYGGIKLVDTLIGVAKKHSTMDSGYSPPAANYQPYCNQ